MYLGGNHHNHSGSKPPGGRIWSGGEAGQHAEPALSASFGWPLCRCREQGRRMNSSFPEISAKMRVAIYYVERAVIHAENKVSAEA